MTATAAERAREHFDEQGMVDLASELIRIPSFTTEETPAAQWVARYFEERGYRVQLQEVQPGRFQTVATLPGSGGGRSLMFNGHLDIDPVPRDWRHDPWTPAVEGNRLYGAGAMNMKGGVAAMIAAAEAVRTSGIRLRGDLVVACVAGELQGGVGTQYLVKHGPRADAAVVTEPYGKDHILTVHTGVMAFAVHTFGRSRHISIREQGGIDAIAKMAKALDALRDLDFTFTPYPALPDLPRINMGGIIGGQGRDYNLRGPMFVSDFCTALGDVRFVPGQSVASVEADIRRALDAVKAGDPEFEYEVEIPPPERLGAGSVVMEPFDLPRDQPILGDIIAAYREVMDREPRTAGGALAPASYAGNDTAHLWAAGIPCVLYGPGGEMGNAEMPDHYTRIDHMSVVGRVLATLAVNFCGVSE